MHKGPELLHAGSGLQIERDAAMNAAVAKMPKQRIDIPIFLKELVEVTQIVPESLQWLLRNLHEFRESTPASKTAVGNFQKQLDDQPQEARVVHGKVGVFILEGWFVGANTDFDIRHIPAGFQRTVAQYLQGDYKTIFDRLDALWAFDTPSVDEILRNREQQEQLLEQSQGHYISRDHLSEP